MLSIDPELFGTKSAESLENLFINTNFLDLLEDKNLNLDLSQLFDIIETRGTHTGEVDALLNAYISEFVNNGQLRIRRFPTVGSNFGSIDDSAFQQILAKKQDQINQALEQKGFLRGRGEKYSQFASFMRSRIRKSSAVTPVTNVADVEGLSQEAFDYLSKNEVGRRRISIAVSADEATRLLGVGNVTPQMLEPFEGTIEGLNRVGSIFYQEPSRTSPDGGYFFKSYSTGKIQRVTGDSSSVAESDVGSLIEQKMTAARAKAQLANLDLTSADGRVLGRVQNVNLASNDIVDIGIRNIQHTEFNEIFRGVSQAATRVRTSTPAITGGNIAEIAGISDRFYGLTSASVDPSLKRLADRGMAFGRVLAGQELTPDEINRLNVGTPLISSTTAGLTKAEAYMAAVSEAGLPYETMDVRSRLARSC